MKQIKLLIILFTLFIGVSNVMAGNFYQGTYRWRNDDGDQASATWKAEENTPVIIESTDVLRLRVSIYYPEDVFSSVNISSAQLGYSVDNVAFTNIVSDGSDNAFELALSDNFEQGDLTTEQLSSYTGAYTFAEGGFMIESTNLINSELPANTRKEFEFCIKPTDKILASTSYFFRISNLSGYSSEIKLTSSAAFAPVISNMPEDINVSVDEGQSYATVSWDEPTATDDINVSSFSSDYSSGDQFAIGETEVTYTATDAAGNKTTASFTIKVTDTPTGIDEKDDNILSIYPNPVVDNIYIKGIIERCDVDIYSIKGIRVYSGTIDNDESIPVSALPNGTYFLMIRSKEKIIKYKFMK
ncbi:HYR domain-containing protein [Plebeiibacterium sediminum]|uniref:HYR domain-containing protein n=1 Tax=Plebeiibacterium sediminum TaxID=2992112 RepID=A0AAE3SGS8_9BACT|nr:HYR domain-containing protein [Plebeiobacterium sediminum]MCW3787608.1 HYR domain-containing protein [Plebeiobacterium sediminum]